MRKVFCIGANKTGTTSLLEFFKYHGYQCGVQSLGEIVFAEAYAKKDWQAIIHFAESATFHQDLPFSAAHTYESLDAAFPDALFILTKRKSAEEWYNSLTRFHAKLFGDGIDPPNSAQLKAAKYRYPGFMWDVNRLLYDTPPNDPYHKPSLIAWYEKHLRDARAYFAQNEAAQNGQANLLEIEISAPDAAEKIADFAGFKCKLPALPHLNRSTA